MVSGIPGPRVAVALKNTPCEIILICFRGFWCYLVSFWTPLHVEGPVLSVFLHFFGAVVKTGIFFFLNCCTVKWKMQT